MLRLKLLFLMLSEKPVTLIKSISGIRGTIGGQPGEGEVEVAGVVDRDHGATGRRDVLLSLDGELQALESEDGTGDADDCSVNGIHSSLA